MARVSGETVAELEGFWRFHHDRWVRNTPNQREYCDLHGLPLTRFGDDTTSRDTIGPYLTSDTQRRCVRKAVSSRQPVEEISTTYAMPWALA